MVAVVIGLLAALLANKDVPHRWLRRWQITREPAYPTDWYGVFARNPDCYVVLHLRNGRRLYGWPSQWPGGENERLFVIDGPQWLMEDRETITAGEALVAQAEDVEMVEFVNVLPEQATLGGRTCARDPALRRNARWGIHKSALEGRPILGQCRIQADGPHHLRLLRHHRDADRAGAPGKDDPDRSVSYSVRRHTHAVKGIGAKIAPKRLHYLEFRLREPGRRAEVPAPGPATGREAKARRQHVSELLRPCGSDRRIRICKNQGARARFEIAKLHCGDPRVDQEIERGTGSEDKRFQQVVEPLSWTEPQQALVGTSLIN